MGKRLAGVAAVASLAALLGCGGDDAADRSLRRDLAGEFAAGDLATGFDVEAEGPRATEADGVPGISLSARRGDGERASAKLNGLGVVIGDLKRLYAGVGLKICSA